MYFLMGYGSYQFPRVLFLSQSMVARLHISPGNLLIFLFFVVCVCFFSVEELMGFHFVPGSMYKQRTKKKSSHINIK